jgi:hypothetical protein
MADVEPYADTVVFQLVWSPVTRPKIYQIFRKSLRHRGIFGLAKRSREMPTDQIAKWGPHTKGPGQLRCHTPNRLTN